MSSALLRKGRAATRAASEEVGLNGCWGQGNRFKASWQKTERADNILKCFYSYAQPLLHVTLLNGPCLTCNSSCGALNFPTLGREEGSDCRRSTFWTHWPGGWYRVFSQGPQSTCFAVLCSAGSREQQWYLQDLCSTGCEHLCFLWVALFGNRALPPLSW